MPSTGDTLTLVSCSCTGKDLFSAAVADVGRLLWSVGLSSWVRLNAAANVTSESCDVDWRNMSLRDTWEVKVAGVAADEDDGGGAGRGGGGGLAGSFGGGGAAAVGAGAVAGVISSVVAAMMASSTI